MKYIVEFEDEPCMYEDEVHYYKCIQAPWWGLSERVIKQLTPYQPDAPDANVGNITNSCGHEKDLISRQAALDAIDSWRRDYPLDLQEPIDDCWNSVRELPAVQPDHNADIGKKVSIPCAHENDLIFRQAAIDALARMMPRSYTPDGSHPADEEIFQAQEVFADCIEALEILPSAQPESCVNTIDALNESIKHFDDMAEECRRNANIERNDYMDMRDDSAEYRQLSIWLNELKWLRERFQSQPEIVRCKDCKYRDPEDKKCDCGHDIRWQLPRHDDWFCADAERRTDE